MTADEVVAVARSWLGTPYHHQASVKGAGCDCLGLLRGVYFELYGHAPEEPPSYSRDLAEATGVETLIEAARRHLVELPPGQRPGPGDAVIFRLRPGAMAKHCAIVSCAPVIRLPSERSAVGRERRGQREGQGWKMIHAFEGGPVSEVALSPWWRRRIATAFSWPPRPQDDFSHRFQDVAADSPAPTYRK